MIELPLMAIVCSVSRDREEGRHEEHVIYEESKIQFSSAIVAK